MVKSLAFVSGKGGVGKTSLAVNSAINLSLSGFRVAVLDTDFGLSNANILMDVKPNKTISDLLSGSCALEDVICELTRWCKTYSRWFWHPRHTKLRF